jgi:hypothetical protein
MRHALLWLLLVAVLLLLCAEELRARQDVGTRTPTLPGTPGVVQVTAWLPFRVTDPSGATLLCSSSIAGRTFPPLMIIGDPTVAPNGAAAIPAGATSATSTTYAPGGGTH